MYDLRDLSRLSKMKTRVAAISLAVLSFGWILMLPFIEDWPDASSVPDMIGRLGLLVLPPVAFGALILLTRGVLLRHSPDRKEYWLLRALCWFTGPVGCAITVFRLTREDSTARE
jgi:hypothetical protein